MSEDLIRQLADFRSKARREAERSYVSLDNKKVHSFVSIHQISPNKITRSKSSFINTNNRTKIQNIIVKEPSKNQIELKIVNQIKDKITNQNSREMSFITNYLKKQEESDKNYIIQKAPSTSFKIFTNKQHETAVSPWSGCQQSNSNKNKENSSRQLNIINLQQNQMKAPSEWNLNILNKENNYFTSKFQNLQQSADKNKNANEQNQITFNKKNDQVEKSKLTNLNNEKNINHLINLGLSNCKKTISNCKITELLPKGRIQQIQDLLIETNETEFDKLNGDYIEELIKLSSVIMYKVKNSKYYRQ